MGRGLVRSDVSAVLFDEPLTVIDPALKWELRSKLKAVHRALDLLMIYVTHDQIEALTFADKVVVMNDGKAVQIGTPDDLFERPEHTFVGYFIGSPGMNLMAAKVSGSRALVDGAELQLGAVYPEPPKGGRVQIGVRPDYTALSSPCPGLPVQVRRVADLGRKRLAYVTLGGQQIVATIPPEMSSIGDQAKVRVRSGAYACLRRRRPRHGSGGMTDKPINNRAWLFVLPVLAFVLFSSIIPVMTVVNYSIQDTMGVNNFFWNGDAWFRDLLDPSTEIGARFNDALFRTLAFSLVCLMIEVPLGIAIALCMPRKGWLVGLSLVVMALPMLIPWTVVGTMWQIFTAPGHRALRSNADRTRPALQRDPGPDFRLGHDCRHRRLALDAACHSVELCGSQSHSRTPSIRRPKSTARAAGRSSSTSNCPSCKRCSSSRCCCASCRLS